MTPPHPSLTLGVNLAHPAPAPYQSAGASLLSCSLRDSPATGVRALWTCRDIARGWSPVEADQRKRHAPSAGPQATMTTPTADLTDRPENAACACLPWALCPGCVGKLQRLRHDWALQQWAENWGAREVKTERQRPQLRVVR